jgi:ADP-ribose pyrophosphatase YjhB (NUDIX family)
MAGVLARVLDPMDLVRELFRGINAGDTAAVARCYAPEVTIEGDRGEPSVGGRPYDVQRIGGIETGWGWVRADWTRGPTPPAAKVERAYTHFWIEDGLIRRQRTVRVAHRPAAADAPRGVAADADGRAGHDGAGPAAGPGEYPSRPVIGVGAVVFDRSGRVLLIRRRHEPLAGQWSLPGGRLELGESLEAGLRREIREEAGIDVDVGPVVEVFDRILVDDENRVRHHYVLVDYLCRAGTTAVTAGGDVSDARFVDPDRLADFRVTEKVLTVVGRARAIRTPDSSAPR